MHPEPRDVMPTRPRPLPQAMVPMMPSPPQAFQETTRRESQVKRRSFLQPWMVIVAIILAGAAVGLIIAMSGPDVAVQHGK